MVTQLAMYKHPIYTRYDSVVEKKQWRWNSQKKGSTRCIRVLKHQKSTKGSGAADGLKKRIQVEF